MEEPIRHPRRHNLEPFRDTGKTRVLRQWLNIIFIIISAVGIGLYFLIDDKQIVLYILIFGCVFKFVELTLRILKL